MLSVATAHMYHHIHMHMLPRRLLIPATTWRQPCETESIWQMVTFRKSQSTVPFALKTYTTSIIGNCICIHTPISVSLILERCRPEHLHAYVFLRDVVTTPPKVTVVIRSTSDRARSGMAAPNCSKPLQDRAKYFRDFEMRPALYTPSLPGGRASYQPGSFHLKPVTATNAERGQSLKRTRYAFLRSLLPKHSIHTYIPH